MNAYTTHTRYIAFNAYKMSLHRALAAAIGFLIRRDMAATRRPGCNRGRSWHSDGISRVLLAGICCLALLGHAAVGHAAASVPGPYAPALDGKVVQFGLSGFEPDFDPIDRVIIAAMLRDGRGAGVALPDSMLVLSAYVENFQPDTTPILPDLLHSNQTATSLGGFMQGKAALVNAAGRIAYRGSLLAEIFLDNSVHLVVDLRRDGAGVGETPLRLRGIFTLSKSLAVQGSLNAIHAGTLAALTAALAAPRGGAMRGHMPAHMRWQDVVNGLTVHPPRMMGTAGSGRRPAKARTVLPAHISTHIRPAASQLPIRSLALGGAALLALAALLVWAWPAMRPRHRGSSATTDSAERRH